MRTALALLLLLAASPALALEPVSVVDGDTIRLRSPLIRIVGVDTPELQARCPEEREAALRAARRLRQLLSQGAVIEYRRTAAGDLARDRYGRHIARVYTADGRDVAQVLIAEGHGRAYDGRTARQSWCPTPPQPAG